MCPVKDCYKTVVNIQRHLTDVHKWSERAVNGVRCKLGIRKDRSVKERKNYTVKVCPLCFNHVRRLNNHLRQVHKILEKQKVARLLSAASTPDDPYEMEVVENTLPTTELKQKFKCRFFGPEDLNLKKNDNKEIIKQTAPDDNAMDTEESCSSSDESQGESDIEDEALKSYALEMDSISAYFDPFKAWLMSIDGGNKAERLASLHVAQVLAIHKATNGSEGHILGLTNSNKIRDNWLSNFMTERKPGTINSYLHSLQYFYSYLNTEKPFGSKGNQGELVECVNRVKHWLKSNRKLIARRKWEKRIEDGQKLATSEDFVKFDNSEPVRNAIKLLASFIGASRLVKKYEYTLIRDYLLTSLCMDNASRTGAIANMRVEEVKRAERDGDSMLITVLDHKTMETSGPAILVLPIVTFNYLDIFLKAIRPQVLGGEPDNEAHCFLSWSGKAMTSSSISDQLNAFWKSATEKHMNAAPMRKSCVTQVHLVRPDMKVKVAAHMCHSVRTAENVYCIQEKKLSSANTSSFIRGIMRNQDTDFKTNPKLNNQLEDSNVRESDKALGSQDEHDLKMLFHDYLEEETSPSMQIVKERIDGHSCYDGKNRAIYDKLRYWVRQKRSEPANLPVASEQIHERMHRYGLQTKYSEDKGESVDDEHEGKDRKINAVDSEYKPYTDLEADDESGVPSLPSDASVRYKYSAKDNTMIKAVFKDMITTDMVITTGEIMKRYKDTSHFKHLVKALTVTQLSDKIRSMRRTCRNQKR